MKIFLAWSGEASKQLALFMHDWLPAVLQAIEPFMSSEDIRKGQRWASEIGAKLAEVNFALLCLTPTNLNSRWIHFEAGAVSKNVEHARVSALLLDVASTQIEFPLQQFQNTFLTSEDLWKLVQDLNGLCPSPLAERPLRKSFERSIGDVDAALVGLRSTLEQEQQSVGKPPQRSTNDILTGILDGQHALASRLDAIDERIDALTPPALSSDGAFPVFGNLSGGYVPLSSVLQLPRRSSPNLRLNEVLDRHAAEQRLAELAEASTRTDPAAELSQPKDTTSSGPAPLRPPKKQKR